MSQRDRAAVDVDLAPIPALVGKSVTISEHLRGKGLIEFDQVHIFQSPADLLEQFWNGFGRCSEQILWFHGSLRVTNNFGKWLQVIFFCISLRRDHNCGGAIIHRGGVSRRYFSIWFE